MNLFGDWILEHSKIEVFLIVAISIQLIKCAPEVPPPPSDYIDEVDVSNLAQKLWTIAVSRDMINIIERITKKILGNKRLKLDRRKITTLQKQAESFNYLKPERRSKQRRKGIN